MTKKDARLLAAALGIRSVVRIHPLLASVGGPTGLWHAGAESLEGALTPEEQRRLEAWLALTRRMLRPSRRTVIDSPEDVIAYLGQAARLRDGECFWSVMLDARGRPLGRREIARGTLTACLVHPREVFAPAIRARAAAVVVVHNHPSGDPTPSSEDVALTDRLMEAGELLGIPLVDHIVLGRNGHRSLGGAPPGGDRDTPVHMAKEPN